MGNLCSGKDLTEQNDRPQGEKKLSLDSNEFKQIWKNIYASAPETLKKMNDVEGVISAFNAGTDAVKKVKPEDLKRWIESAKLDSGCIVENGPKEIKSVSDVVRGIIECFRVGKGEEWIIKSDEVHKWIVSNINTSERYKEQMGGQAGIIGNVMSVTNVKKVYCHTGSHTKIQSGNFVKRDNIFSADQDGKCQLSHTIDRVEDSPYVNTIFEFDKGDEIEFFGQKIVCPRANRFIASYGNGQFDMYIDKNFPVMLKSVKTPIDFILLSGYQLQSEYQTDGKTLGAVQMDYSWDLIADWKKQFTNMWVHLEYASTQDRTILKRLTETIAKKSDSIGMNEQELIDILEVIGQKELAENIEKDKHAPAMIDGLVYLLQYTGVKKILFHFLGIYISLSTPDYQQSSETMRNGLVLAATIGAAKAKVGDIEKEENLLKAHGTEVADLAQKELQRLSQHLTEKQGQNNILNTGIFECSKYKLVTIPTILIDKPVTLVGMGDTISSLSLVGSR